ncbi:KICSTOR complex protein ITFG2-like isoform X2 [Anthonomus grandis grandis]|uniref:KICSTOR complex protein ITFG2-like isoform X2 n=1 Tax=Anthonomus grandis grandis TaxID=2921223 RepID=UPI0021661842|nr:KICSTOR complex protein ITFG2-like isoform X2 [Anthonomus grandis grandis]
MSITPEMLANGKQKLQSITDLSFIACVAVGDIRNEGRNSLVIITADGWCYIYEVPSDESEEITDKKNVDEVDGQGPSSNPPNTTTNTETQSSSESTLGNKNVGKKNELKNPLICVHVQRIPSNTKNIILDDVDGDGQIEMVLGLTDRVLRSYRFLKNIEKTANEFVGEKHQPEDKFLGKFVALNKWECANQIGSITTHHSYDGRPSILVAQPGGTFMRIKCHAKHENPNQEQQRSINSETEPFPGSVDYQFLGISRMRNQNISTEIIGDLKCRCKKNNNLAITDQKSCPYALATLDGSIMLVQDEVILWAIAVDHQIFALTKLDVTGNGCDDIVVCSWDGQTYILDQNKNSVRFHLEEPVRAFHSGWYNVDVDKPSVTALVYVTFKNSIIIYYDIPLKDLICKKFEPELAKLSELYISKDKTKEEALKHVQNMDNKTRRELVEYLLYNAKC